MRRSKSDADQQSSGTRGTSFLEEHVIRRKLISFDIPDCAYFCAYPMQRSVAEPYNEQPLVSAVPTAKYMKVRRFVTANQRCRPFESVRAHHT